MVGEPAPAAEAGVDEAAEAGVDEAAQADVDEAAQAGVGNAVQTGIDEAALAELEVRLASASLDLTDRLLHAAFQEMEAAMFEQVSNRLRAELPDVVARIIREHFAQTS